LAFTLRCVLICTIPGTSAAWVAARITYHILAVAIIQRFP